MKVIVSHESALYYWRHTLTRESDIACRCTSDPFSSLPIDAYQDSMFEPDPHHYGGGCVHLLVRNDAQRVAPTRRTYHVCRQELPPSAFCEIGVHEVVVSPELCFVQMAEKLNLNQLIELGVEMCGSYALVPESDEGSCSRECSLTTLSELTAFVNTISGVRGISQARKALKHIFDGSESPMETRMDLLTMLPMRLGGEGYQNGKANAIVPIDGEDARRANRKELRCDLLLTNGKKKVVLEYDSNLHHLKTHEHERDAVKYNILEGKKYTVFIVTPGQILDMHSFDRLMEDVRRELGLRKKERPPYWEDRRQQLRDDLFASMGNSAIARRAKSIHKHP